MPILLKIIIFLHVARFFLDFKTQSRVYKYILIIGELKRSSFVSCVFVKTLDKEVPRFSAMGTVSKETRPSWWRRNSDAHSVTDFYRRRPANPALATARPSNYTLPSEAAAPHPVTLITTRPTVHLYGYGTRKVHSVVPALFRESSKFITWIA